MGIPLPQLSSRIREGAASREAIQSFSLEPESCRSLTLSLWVRQGVTPPAFAWGVLVTCFLFRGSGRAMHSPQNLGWWGLCLGLSPGLSGVTSHAGLPGSAVSRPGLWEWAVGAAEFFKPLGMSRSVLAVPTTVMSGSCLDLTYSLLLTWSFSKLGCWMPGLASAIHVSVTSGCWWWCEWLLEDGLCPLMHSSASCGWVGHFVPAGSECEAREAGWSQLELLHSPALQFPCVWGCLPRAWVGSLTDAARCPGPSPAPSHCSDLCWDTCVERDPSPVFIPSFFLVYFFLSPGSQILPARLGLFLAALHMCLLENLVTTYLGSWTKLSVQREPWLVMK